MGARGHGGDKVHVGTDPPQCPSSSSQLEGEPTLSCQNLSCEAPTLPVSGSRGAPCPWPPLLPPIAVPPR